MERKNAFRTVILLFLFVLLVSCGPKPLMSGQKPETEPRTETGQSLQNKSSEWDSLVFSAKKEGRISLYSVANGSLKVALVKAMRERFGLDLDVVTGRSAELVVKLHNERKAGIFVVDVYIGGGSILNDLKPSGAFDPLEPQLFLPEVLDKNLWWEGRLPFYDRDKQVFAFVANPGTSLAINTNLVSREETRSYLDLLNPKWKGKMVLNDPSTPGSSQGWFQIVSSRIMNVDYMRKLAQMDLTVTRDQRLQVEWLSRGKFSIAIGPQGSTVSQFQKDGAPVELTTPKEGTYLTASSGSIALLNKAPHPKAARLFINWLLTKEGQTILSEATSFQSARVDVPTGHMPPDTVRKPEVKYFSNIDEEVIATIPEYIKMAQEIFGPLMK